MYFYINNFKINLNKASEQAFNSENSYAYYFHVIGFPLYTHVGNEKKDSSKPYSINIQYHMG